MSNDYGQELVNKANEQVLEGTWEYAGQTNDLDIYNIGYSDFQLLQKYGALAGGFEGALDEDEIDEDEIKELGEKAEELPNLSWEDDDEDVDFVVSVIEEKLVKPNVDVEKTDYHILSAIVEGMFETWQEDKNVKNAKGEMPVDNPNR